jgi:hypothetical protein
MCLVVSLRTAQAAPIVGTFDFTRGGLAGFADNPAQAPTRALLQSNFPGLTFAGSSTLTPGFFAGVNLAFLTSAFSNSVAVAPLSAAEQTALLNFVLAGGNAIISIDNFNQSSSPPADATHESLLDPFGLDADGDLFNFSPVVGMFVNAAHPIANGPFGAAANYLMNRPGYFSSLGPYAQPIIVDPFGNVVMAVIERGALGPGTGSVVFNADNSVLDPALAANNLPTVLNAFAFSMPVPEPTSAVLALAGATVLTLARRRRRRSQN